MIDLNHSRNLAVRRRAGYFHVPLLLSVLVAALKRQLLLIFGWLIFATPVAVQAQFNSTVTDGTVTITRYTGPGGVVVIPDTITGLPVTAIDFHAFRVFADCAKLTNVTIPNSVVNIWYGAFYGCSNLSSVAIPHSVTNIGDQAFFRCISLTNVTIPSSVTRIGGSAFRGCTNLAKVYFQGNAPSFFSSPFSFPNNTTAYYLPGTTGWGSTFGGIPTVLLPLVMTSNPSFGVRSNQFGFTISWATNLSVVVEATTDLANPVWSPLATNTLPGGWFYFNDPEWNNYHNRFYRVRSQ